MDLNPPVRYWIYQALRRQLLRGSRAMCTGCQYMRVPVTCHSSSPLFLIPPPLPSHNTQLPQHTSHLLHPYNYATILCPRAAITSRYANQHSLEHCMWRCLPICRIRLLTSYTDLLFIPAVWLCASSAIFLSIFAHVTSAPHFAWGRQFDCCWSACKRTVPSDGANI